MKQLPREGNVFYIKCGEHLTLAKTITEYFWHVNSRRISQTHGSPASFHPADDGPFHPFDTLFAALNVHEFLKDKKIMVFCKRMNIADFVAIRLRRYGIKAASIHK